MKKKLSSIAALLLTTSCWANVTNVADEDFRMHIDTLTSLQDIARNREETSLLGHNDRQDAPATYKSWWGETCLDLGDSKQTYYNWRRDVTYVGIPLFISSFIIKQEKKAFRSARFSVNENWKTKIDDYTQYSPYAVLIGLKACGYEGRSSWDRMLTSALLSNAVMAVAVNACKYSFKEMRPDNTSANSFPSGHTATAFAAATVLHKEYGVTRSPLFSVGGYVVALGTGFMRVLNNRHWISDVMAGAGIGILSTEIGYFLGDLLYRNKGITRLELSDYSNPNHPSFFDIQMGVGLHKHNIRGTFDSGKELHYELGTSTVIGVESAYFINKYLGIGGMARVTTTPTMGLDVEPENRSRMEMLNTVLQDNDLPCVGQIDMNRNQFVDGSFDAGVYGNLPLSRRFALGAKFLCGVRTTSGYNIKARTGYRTKAKDGNNNHIVTGTIDNGQNFVNYEDVYVFENPNGSLFNSNETLMPGVSRNYNYYLDPTRFRSDEYSLSKLTGGTSINYVLGLSATYRYKENFAWKIFADLDSSRSRYHSSFDILNDQTLQYIEGELAAAPATLSYIKNVAAEMHNRDSFTTHLTLFTIGASFSVSF